MNPLIIIPARGGSKGIPGKNSKLLAGKPLIQYTIEAALGVFNADQICVSTDSLEIKNVAESLGLKVPFLRPAELATDTASSRD
jgi:CMP-N,N'-diacetyllegionaminic acid synthase